MSDVTPARRRPGFLFDFSGDYCLFVAEAFCRSLIQDDADADAEGDAPSPTTVSRPDNDLVNAEQLELLEDATFEQAASTTKKQYMLTADRIRPRLARQLAELESFMTNPLVLSRTGLRVYSMHVLMHAGQELAQVEDHIRVS